MEKTYETPEVRILRFLEDVITTSIPSNNEGVANFDEGWLNA